MQSAKWSLFVVLCLVSTASAQSWEKFKDEKGNFRASVPTKAQRISQMVDTDVGQVEAIFYLAEVNEGKVVYALAYSDYPQNFADAADPEVVLDGVRDGNIKPHNGTVKTETKIKMDGFPGREYTFAGRLNGDGDPLSGHVRLFLVGPRLYQLIVLWDTSAEMEPENIGRFFYSFERLKR